MITFSNNIQRIDIEIEGYAYPFSKDEWDANWLSIKIFLKESISEKDWELSDTCLLTMELKDLKDWFIKIKNNLGNTMEIKFIEPALGFIFQDNQLKIILKYNLSPYYDESNDEPYIIQVEDKFVEFDKIISDLEDYIKKFPQKGNPK